MAGGHVLIESLDSISTGELTILLVHVMCPGARVIADPDAKVLDFERFLLRDLMIKKES
jgi:hypothetical protein